MASSSPPKSEVSNSTLQRDTARIAATVAAHTPAPPSDSSSRFTMVTTTWRSPISATASATRRGSSRSSSVGRPVATEQNRHRRVHTLPRIMKVAVPWVPQHSWMFGQRASSHTVVSALARIRRRTAPNSSLAVGRVRSQSGLR